MAIFQMVVDFSHEGMRGREVYEVETPGAFEATFAAWQELEFDYIDLGGDHDGCGCCAIGLHFLDTWPVFV